MNVSGQSNCTPVKVPECRLSEDLGSLFDRSAFSDVTLCVGGREFLAHKAVLAGKNLSALMMISFKFLDYQYNNCFDIVVNLLYRV